MSNTLKLTIVGGGKSGKKLSFDCSRPVSVGRSRSADLRLSEPDVSGKHFKFVGDGSGVVVRVESQNGLVVDGRILKRGESAAVNPGSEIEVGTKARIRIDSIGDADASVAGASVDVSARAESDQIASVDSCSRPDSSTKGDIIPSIDSVAMGGASISEVGQTSLFQPPGATPVVTDLDGAPELAAAPEPAAAESAAVTLHAADTEAETAQDPASGGQHPGPVAVAPLASPANVEGFDEDGIAADDDDSLTIADGDGETQEMKTRIGSMEEIREREHQLERTAFRRRVRMSVMLGMFMLILAGVWFSLNWSRRTMDVDGPYLSDGKSFDQTSFTLFNAEGQPEFYLLYPRYRGMKVAVSADSNSVEVATWFGTKKDVPFHLEFTRWSDPTDLMRSLEGSFERWMIDETAKGSAFETHGGKRPAGEFFEDVFPNWCETLMSRGVRFIRAEYTRSRNGDLWHGNCFYFRNGDRIHLLRSEIPDMFWKMAKRRITKELHLAIYETFSINNWDSPGMSGILDSKMSDDELIARIRRELSAERVSAWPDLAVYIDTLLVRSWGDKPSIQKEALFFFQQMQEHMVKFYQERELAYITASANRDDKRVRGIVKDCKDAFGKLPRDRRSMLVNNPEVWSCRPRR